MKNQSLPKNSNEFFCIQKPQTKQKQHKTPQPNKKTPHKPKSLTLTSPKKSLHELLCGKIPDITNSE